jgi:hypothetical protein
VPALGSQSDCDYSTVIEHAAWQLRVVGAAAAAAAAVAFAAVVAAVVGAVDELPEPVL